MCQNLEENQTIEMIKKKFGLGSDSENFEILEDYYKLSLLCPLTKKRLQLPARGTNCQHLECFDLRSYLSLTHNSILTNCPICKSYFVKSTLRIDKFTLKILSDANSTGLSEVNIDRTGNWVKVGENRKIQKQSFEETILIENDTANETIVISDDDDDDDVNHTNANNISLQTDIAKIVQRSVKKEIGKKPVADDLSKKIIAAIENDINQIKELLIANVIISGNNSSAVKKEPTKTVRARGPRGPRARKQLIKPEPIIPEESIKHRLRTRKSLFVNK